MSTTSSAAFDDIAGSTEEMLTLFSLARGLTSLNTLQDVGDVIAKHLRRLIPSNLSVLFAYDADADELIVVHASGEHAGSVTDLRIGTGQRLSGWVAANRRTIRNSDPVLDFGEAARAMTPRLRSCLVRRLSLEAHSLVCSRCIQHHEMHSARNISGLLNRRKQVMPAVQQAAELQKTRSNVVRDRQTGLPKLESFRDLAAAQIADASQQRPVSLVVIEMPDREHSSAEPYLSHVVRAVRRSLRAADMLFRHRDTDLVALLLQTDRPTGMSIGNRISQAMIDLKSKEALDLTNIAPAHVSVVSAPEDGTTIDELLQKASIRGVSADDGHRAMDNTLLPSIRALWRFLVIRFLSLSRLATSRPLHSFSKALDREG